MAQKGPFLPFLIFSQTKTMKTECFFSLCLFTTFKGQLRYVFTYYNDEYTRPITAKYSLAMLRNFHERK
jgi:hypothetical protein